MYNALMTSFAASLDRDANHVPLAGGVMPFLQRKSRTYTGAAGLGATGATTLFTVTGTVLARIFGACQVDLAGATATIEGGIAGNTAALIAQTTATNIDAGMSWVDATPATIEGVDFSNGFIIAAGQDILETIATAAISAGQLDFYCFWRPLSVDGAVVAA